MLPVFAVSHDPADEQDARERKSSILTKRDRNILLFIALPILGCMLYIGLRFVVRHGEKTRCASNFGAMSTALNLYQNEWDNQFPPAYMTGPNLEPITAPNKNGESTMPYPEGKPYTWISLLKEYMTVRNNFQCRSATAEENTLNANSDGESIVSSYGLYVGIAGRPLLMISRPGDVVAIAESSNMGARSSFDPHPFKDSSGTQVPVDGFLIGYDTGNYEFEAGLTKSVTRLAFPDTKSGKFSKLGETRHDGGNHFLFADGHLGVLKPNAAKVRFLNDEIVGTWANDRVRIPGRAEGRR